MRTALQLLLDAGVEQFGPPPDGVVERQVEQPRHRPELLRGGHLLAEITPTERRVHHVFHHLGDPGGRDHRFEGPTHDQRRLLAEKGDRATGRASETGGGPCRGHDAGHRDQTDEHHRGEERGEDPRESRRRAGQGVADGSPVRCIDYSTSCRQRIPPTWEEHPLRTARLIECCRQAPQPKVFSHTKRTDIC